LWLLSTTDGALATVKPIRCSLPYGWYRFRLGESFEVVGPVMARTPHGPMLVFQLADSLQNFLPAFDVVVVEAH